MTLEPELPSLDDDENHELRDFTMRFWWTLPLTLVIVVLAMWGHRWAALSPQARAWLELTLSVPVVVWAGWSFLVRCVQSIRHRSPNMWTLIGIGVSAAFGYSVVATVAPGLFPASFRAHGRVGVYFEAAAVIVSLTLLGQMLELRARSKTSTAIKALLGLAPKTWLYALYDREPLARFVRGRIALVGDAAHPMLPFLAQGAAQAFEDGAALALCLREAGPGRARLGLERYERARLERASEVQRLSRGRPDINHLPDGPDQIRRDAQLAAQDPLEHNTWLYEHDVEAALRGSDVASPLH